MVYASGPFPFDARESVLLRDGRPMAPTPKAVSLLLALIEHRGQVVTKQEFFDRVWPGTFVSDSTLTFQVHLVRKALGTGSGNEKHMAVVRRRGYCFVAQVTGKALWPYCSTQLTRPLLNRVRLRTRLSKKPANF